MSGELEQTLINDPTRALNSLAKRVKRVNFDFWSFGNCRIGALL